MRKVCPAGGCKHRVKLVPMSFGENDNDYYYYYLLHRSSGCEIKLINNSGDKMNLNLWLIFSHSPKKSGHASGRLGVFVHFLLDLICPQQKHQFISDVAVFGPLCEASAIAALLFGWTELPQQTFLNPFTLQREKKHRFLCWQDYFFGPFFFCDFSYNNNQTLTTVL